MKHHLIGRKSLLALFFLFSFYVSVAQPANNNCSISAPILTMGVGTTGTVASATLDGPAVLNACNGGTERYDVWYRFVPHSTNPTITLTGLGGNFTNPALQISTSCSAGSLFCGTTSINATGLTIDATYYLRVYSTAASIPTTNAGFTVTATDGPVNDECSGTTPLLTSGVTITGTVVNATLDGALTNCTGTELYDVWYRFVAQSSNPIINLSNLGGNFTSPGLQISSACGTGSLFCGTTSINASSLSIGTTYYLRVFSTAASIPTTNADFDITLIDPPSNDACSGTVPLLVTGATTTGTVANASLDGPAALNSCNSGAELYDVWYRFTATSTSPTVYLSNIGSNFTNTGIQIATSCTAGSLNCGTTSVNATTVIGTTYYVRVFSTAATIPSTNAGFGITVIDPLVNDLVASAIVLTPAAGCDENVSTKSNQSLSFSTYTAAATSGSTCTDVNARDVWYKFVATETTHNILLNNLGSSWGGTQRIQLLTNSNSTNGSGTWTNIACTNGSLLTATTVVGTTYFIRIHNNTTGAITGGTWGFSICVTRNSAISASRMKEVFSRTVLSAPNVMDNPWEITYSETDNSLWVTDSKNYMVYRINPTTGVKQTVLDLSPTSTFTPNTYLRQTANSFSAGDAQGGLAGLALHPNFMDGTAGEKNWVYISYIYSKTDASYFTNRLVKFVYNKTTFKLETPTIICDTLPGSNDHNSQRIIIAPVTVGGTQYLFYASGDMGAGQGSATNRARVIKSQFPDSYEGKILRFNLDEDGDATQSPVNYNRWIPNDNPYNTLLGKQSAVWNIGIRNNQGFAYDPVSNILYGTSHGAYSDDELNILKPFKNYGHPLILGHVDGNYDGTSSASSSTSYSAGAPYGSGSGNSTCVPIVSEAGRRTEINAMGYGDYEDPLFSAYAGDNSATTNSVKYIWSQSSTPNNSLWPSEGWSGLDLYTNKVIPGWKQSLVASGLKWGRLIRLKLGATGTTTLPSNVTGGANTGDTVLYLQSGNRYRDIAFGPNGKDIYVIMDGGASSAATDGNPPVTPACADCLIKYTFLGYSDDGSGKSTIPTSIDVTTATAGSCVAGTTVTIDATNNRLWVPITGPDGNIMAEIYANGSNLGVVTSSFYKNPSSTVRSRNGVYYLDRNITINPANVPTSTVKIRLYISKAEYQALDAVALTGSNDMSQLKILKNSDACGSNVNLATSLLATTMAAHGANGYVLTADITSFSSFYFGATSTTLPVDLLTFTGALQNNKTLLQWTTENELNASHFVVERSTDAINFSGIGTVKANNNTATSVVNNYSLTDADVANQNALIIYYRLKMIDQNGQYKYSNVISVTLADITSVSIAPNPVTNEARVSVIAPADGQVQYKLTDNAGRTIITKSQNVTKGNISTLTIDVSRLAAGSYFLHVTGAGLNSNTKVQKL